MIDGRRLPPGPSSHAEHQAAATQWQRQDVHATLLGFYSASDQGVFTHRDSRTHVHCVVDEVTTGHVDRVVVRAGAVIRFPTRRPIAATNAQRP